MSGGVRYISESLIKKITKEDNPLNVFTLNLNLSKQSKKFRFIEHLEKYTNLQVLNLSHNAIFRINNLGHFRFLQELNISHNQLTRIESLQQLVSLLNLNLSHNSIESIPLWIGTDLVKLQVLRLEFNRIASLNDVKALTPLAELTDLSLEGNPLCRVQHWKLYCVYHVPSLGFIDSSQISENERQIAQERFSKDFAQLKDELKDKDQVLAKTEETKREMEKALKAVVQGKEKLAQREQEQEKLISDLKSQIDCKDQLLKKKTSELNNAVDKSFELEQELAYYKIDRRFDLQTSRSEDDISIESVLDDAAYIGKSRPYFPKQEKSSKRKFLNSSYPVNMPFSRKYNLNDIGKAPTEIGSLSKASSVPSLNECNSRFNSLEERMQSANDALQSLSDQLDSTENVIRTRGNDNIRKNPSTSSSLDNLTNFRLKSKDNPTLCIPKVDASSSDALNALKENSLPASLYVKKKKLQQSEAVSSPLESTRRFHDLQSQLDQMLGMVRSETDTVRKLENQLFSPTNTPSSGPKVTFNNPLERGPTGSGYFPSSSQDFEQTLSRALARTRDDSRDKTELKSELEGVIASLTEYLNHMKHDMSRYKKENDRLRAQLNENSSKFHDLQLEKNALASQNDDNQVLQNKVSNLLEILKNEERSNEDLKRELSKYPDLSTIESMKNAEKEAGVLRDAVRQLREETQAEREALNAQLRAEKRRSEDLHKRLEEVDKKDSEIKNLSVQLSSSKTSNDSLKDRVKELQLQIKENLAASIKPEDLLRHIQEMTINVEKNGGDVYPYHDMDLSGRALMDLQKVINSKFNEFLRDQDTLKLHLDQSKNLVKDIENELRHEQDRYFKLQDKSTSLRNNDKATFELKINKWQEEVQRLKEKIQVQREMYDREMSALDQEKRAMELEMKELEKLALRNEIHENEKFLKIQSELESLTEQIKSEKAEHSKETQSLENRLRNSESQRHSLEKEQSKLEKAIAAIERDLAMQQLQNEQHSKTNADLMRQLEKEQESCEAHQETIRKLKEELQNLKQKCAIQKDDIAKLSVLFEKALEGGLNNNEVKRLQSEISSMQSHISGQEATIRNLSDALEKSELKNSQPKFVMDSKGGYLIRTDDVASPHFCNIIEHHRLEDYVTMLKSKLQKVTKGKKIESLLKNKSKNLEKVDRLYEKQKQGFDSLKEEVDVLERKKRVAIGRFEALREVLHISVTSREFLNFLEGKGSSGLPYDIKEASKKYEDVVNELGDLEDRLLKRKIELQETEALLLECENDLKDVQERAKETIMGYDTAKNNLSSSHAKALDISKQVQYAILELTQARQQSATLKDEVADLERKKSNLDQELKDINQIISRKDLQFRDLEEKKSKLHSKIESIHHEEDEVFGHLKASEKALNERKNELLRLQNQAQQESIELQKVDTELVRKKSELQLLKDEIQSKKDELTSTVRDTEDDMSRKNREIKDTTSLIEDLKTESQVLDAHIKDRRSELNNVRENFSKEEIQLQNLKIKINQSNQELRSLQDLVKLERSELEDARSRKMNYLTNGVEY